MKSFPTNRRGTFFGFSQFIGGLSAVLAGFLISKILGDTNLIFPKNYGMLLLIELVIFLLGFSFFFILKEKPDEEPKDKISLLESLKEIPRIIRENQNVRRLTIIQFLISFYSMAFPFYSIYILTKLSASESLLGLLLTFQMLGRLIFSFISARLCNRNLNKKLIQYSVLMLLAPPILTVAIGTLPSRVIAYSSLLIFTFIGASMGGIWVGIQNYVISEVKDKRRRPILLGFISSINVITSILPLLGGIIVGYLPYEAVFVASFIPILFSLMLTHNLK